MRWRSRVEQKVIWTIVIVIVLLIALGAYGYYSGAWNRDPLNSGYDTSDK